tara:strand:- start:5 stop:826 length:822 start_codon:yes stop_codon:yes gene_type:complete
MRIALCLTGLLGGLNGKNGIGKKIDPRNGHYWFNINILKNQIVDVFFHTWGDFDSNLVSLYNPKKYLFETQSDFSEVDYKFYNCNSYDELYKKENKLNKNYVTNIEEVKILKDQIFRSNSKWASTYKVINLKKEYENENNFEYDFVIISRFDIALTEKIDFSKLKKNILYLSKRGKKQAARNFAFNDLIFLGDSQIIDLFVEIFPQRNKYSIDPIFGCYEHINKNCIRWDSIFEFGENTFILRWNQHLMKYDPQLYYFIKHKLREIKKNFLND